MAEPMDIDNSFNNSGNNSLCLKAEQFAIATLTPEKYALSTPLFITKVRKKSKVKKWLTLSIIFLLTICTIYWREPHYFYRSQEIDIQGLSQFLMQNLHGQDTAIHSIMEAFLRTEKFQVSIFIGQIGTGKTLATNLISAFIGNAANIFRITHSYNDVDTVDFCIKSLSRTTDNIIIVDDLQTDDVPTLLPILQWKSHSMTSKIHIILVCSGSNISEVQNVVMEKMLQKTTPILTIAFEELNHQVAIQCINDAFKARGLEINADLQKTELDIDVKAYGCKGIHNKIALLLLNV